MARPVDAEWKRELDAMTLTDVWPIVTRTWLRRRQCPDGWRLIANNAKMADYALKRLERELDRPE